MRLRIRDTSFTLKIIGWQQIIGGIMGIYLMASLMLQQATVNGVVLLIILTGIALYIYSIYSGKSLLIDANKKVAIILSIINQVFQLVQWSMLGYGFTYSSGAEVSMGFVDSPLNFNIAAYISTFKMSINTDPEFLLKVNLIALIVMLVLLDILNEPKDGVKVTEELVQTPEAPAP